MEKAAVNELHEALLYDKLPESYTQCHVCQWQCKIALEKQGVCCARQNIDGKVYALNYAQVTSLAVDPIEKKPLYHFFPGSQILSLGTYGCNLSCQCCQNYTISKAFPRSRLGHPSSSVEEIMASLAQLSQRLNVEHLEQLG